MKKARKALYTLCAALLLVSMTVGVTVAYLTDSDEVVNTFTVGKVHIDLDECESEYNPETNEYEDMGTRTEDGEGQHYKLMPGIVIDKDPTVKVLDESEDCYVRAFVTVTYNEAADTVIPADFFTTWIKGYDQAIWTPYADGYSVTKAEGKITRTYELRYASKVVEPGTLKPIFTGVELPDTLNNADIAKLDGLEIAVKANAIQADGFANAAEAWEAFHE